MNEQQRQEYCKDCKRSIYAENPSCDVNIENNGYYNLASNECKCKVIISEGDEQ